MTRTAGKSREQVYKQLVMAIGLVPRGHLLANCHRECSVNCHGEESFKTTRPSCFCHYERSEVIQKQMLLASRLRPPRHKCGSRQAHI